MKNINEKGFTLIELMIVIVILGILIGIAVPGFSGVKKKADLTVVKSDLHNIMYGLEMYYMDQKSYPTATTAVEIGTLTDLDLSLSNPSSDYNYQSGNNEKSYLAYYLTSDNEYYYVNSSDGMVAGPSTTTPTP